MTSAEDHQPGERQSVGNQDQGRDAAAKIDLGARYRRIGISAVAAAARYSRAPAPAPTPAPRAGTSAAPSARPGIAAA